MAVPFRKVSKTRRNMRRTHYKITANGMVLLDKYRQEWSSYKKNIDKILLGD